MPLIHAFQQTSLIQSTGNQIQTGICLGLVTQWLISIAQMPFGDEPKFWTDLSSSLANHPNTPFFGAGYARKAIEFQHNYLINLGANPSTGDYTKEQLKADGDLSFNSATCDVQTGAFTPGFLPTIARKVLNDPCRYFILGIMDGGGAHAIGIYRQYSMVGNSSNIRIFDSNIGKYECSGITAVQQDLQTIGNFYQGTLNTALLLEAYR